MKKFHKTILAFSLILASIAIGIFSASISDSSVVSTILSALPEGKPVCCDEAWNIRMLFYQPEPMLPRRMYFASCNKNSSSPKMFSSVSLGKKGADGKKSDSSGAIIESSLNVSTGKLEQTGKIKHFPECVWMEGIDVSDDCRTITALCRRKFGDSDFDIDSLSGHPEKDWMTQPKCAELSMWMYEWKNGDISSKPKKILLNKAVDYAWETGNSYLRNAENDKTYGVNFKARVVDPQGQCHEADTFLVLNQKDYKITDRGYTWACGTGHTTFNRPAYNPFTKKYASFCTTDFSERQKSDKFAGFWFRMEGKESKNFAETNSFEQIRLTGGTGRILPMTNGGFIGIVVGDPGRPVLRTDPLKQPASSVGIVKFSSNGEIAGKIQWIVSKTNVFLSYPQLVPLGKNRYLLGYGEMKRLKDNTDTDNNSFLVPWKFFLQEIDENGKMLTMPHELTDTGWGEQDEMVSLGKGRAGWAYIPSPQLKSANELPNCNASSLQLSSYTSPEISSIEEEVKVSDVPDAPANNIYSNFNGDENLSKSDAACKNSYLTGIKWHHGMIVDRMRGICSNSKETDDIGAPSGNGPSSFICKGKENYIKKMKVYAFGWSEAIERFKVICNNGDQSEIIGGWGDTGKLQSESVQCPEGTKPIGLSGNKNDFLKVVGFLCK